jgi:hypothetical protein
VYHQEGTTLGTDTSDLKQHLMLENKQKFASKWTGQLNGEPPAAPACRPPA